MNPPYRLYGAALSPYSMKVRAYLAFKGVPFTWLARTQARGEEFQKYAKLPLIPVLVDSDETALQDSTLIIEALEAAHPEPALAPGDPALAFLAALIEDYADEWLNKAMFHYRWTYPADQESAARRIVDGMFEGEDAPNREAFEAVVRERMVGRLRHVGSNAETAPVIEGALARLLDTLDAHLAGRLYLFGARPCLADFGLAAQLAQLASDPTPAALIASRRRVSGWLERMETPRAEGAFEDFASLRAGLAALLRDEVAATYAPWILANAAAVAADANAVSLEVDGRAFTQAPQRYAAKALAAIRAKRAAVESEALQALLEETGCAALFAAASAPAALDEDGDDGDDEGEDEQS